MDVLFNRQNYYNNNSIIYAITPTYSRAVQEAELTRISHVVSMVPCIRWIIIEDSKEKTKLVSDFIAKKSMRDLKLKIVHLNIETNDTTMSARTSTSRTARPRGVSQRNLALKWLRAEKLLNDAGSNNFVYFMDDDNTYSVELFMEILKIKKGISFIHAKFISNFMIHIKLYIYQFFTVVILKYYYNFRSYRCLASWSCWWSINGRTGFKYSKYRCNWIQQQMAP